ncbi:MAG: hypothetical protein H0T21_02655 [Gemmatimonadaceae bacterium]|nr:hypothetical protein [Gemmatimonadaceae bacterium]
MSIFKCALGLLCFLSIAAVPASRAQIAANPEARWWKGNLHTHTLWSDGNDFPEMVVEFYRERGYNFLALSDHNVLTQGQKWIPLDSSARREMKSRFDRYLRRFGGHWVETRGTGNTNGLPLEVRLKPLSEFRSLFEDRGVFLMIPGEEITNRFPLAAGSDSAAGKFLAIHLNATNLLELINPQGGATVSEMIDNNLKAVHEQEARTGQQMLPHLNHPNFQYAVTAEEIANAVSDHFFEIFNGHPGTNQRGDSHHAPMEKLWDIANTIRLTNLNTAPLYGLATDDSHHYDSNDMSRSIPGRGWIMVRARHLTPESLIRAIKSAEFYASSGVTFNDVRYDSTSRTLAISIKAEPGVEYTTSFIGTPVSHDLSSTAILDEQGKPIRATRRYKDEIGKTFATVRGTAPTFNLTGAELYVRAVVTSSKPHPRQSFVGQTEQAWTQPVGWMLKKAAR